MTSVHAPSHPGRSAAWLSRLAPARLRLLALGAFFASLAPAARADDANEAAPVQFDPLEIRDQRARDENYKAAISRTATKTATPLQDVPQSISVVTAEQILDQQMKSLAELARYVPGVSSQQGENNRDQIIFRGQNSSADFFLNGVRDDVQYYRDFYNLERVEVLRGPNAMIFGRGGGGGVINRTTKEADFAPLRAVTLQAGSFDFKRATLDLNQPLNAALAARLNAVAEDSASFRDSVTLRREGVNPTLTLQPDQRTKLTLAYEYFRDKCTADRGITSLQGRPADVPIETFYGDPAQSRAGINVHLVTAAFERRLGRLTIRDRALIGNYSRGYQNFVPGATTPDQSLVALTAYNNATHRRNFFNQTDLTYTAATGALRHTLLGGLEFGRQLTDNFRNTGYFNNAATSILVPFAAPTIAAPVTWRQSATDANNHLKLDLGALYAQDQIEFSPRWQAIAGLRLDSFDLQFTNNRTGEYLARRDRLVSPRAGLVFKPAGKISLYANYAVSYLPSSGDQFAALTTITRQMQPEKFTNYELGAKWALLDRLDLTTAVYRLDRTNTRATDPTDPTRLLQTGRQRTRGFELGLVGTLTPRWTATAGYAYQDASIVSATASAPAGATVAQVPRHTFSFWNKYQLARPFAVGLGLVGRSAMFAAIDDTVVLPGYATLDAALYYAIGRHWRLQANIENLLDRRYYLNADSNTNISPGSPFAIRVALTARY